MTELLEAMAKMGDPYGRFLLAEGKGYEVPPRQLPRKWRRLKGKARECFVNAANAAIMHEELTYCEGYGFIEPFTELPIHHAWLIGPGGEVIDPTWPDAAGYLGVEFETELVCEAATETRMYGDLIGYQLRNKAREVCKLLEGE